MLLIAGILWGVFMTHNIEQTQYFKCKHDKNVESCKVVEQLKTKGE